ncbi:hypothetical protein ACLOJK_030644 [Asimina triloba]
MAVTGEVELAMATTGETEQAVATTSEADQAMTATGKAEQGCIGTGTRKANEEQESDDEKGFEGDRREMADEQFLAKSKVGQIEGTKEGRREDTGKIATKEEE